MEPDLPSIDISAEDDALIPLLGDTSVSASPLISSIERLKDKANAAKYNNLSADCNGNKENINVSKSDLTKLSVEPQQMKRRKKGNGYNLRKSLAWDKAFSTDEGFLDPSELSMLGGSNGNSYRELLPSISEDGGKFSGNSVRRGDSSDLQGTPKKWSNQKGSSSGSKSCCPRPLVFSSLKRPANTSILKAAAKESKLPKLPASFSGHSIYKSSKPNLPSTSQSCQTKYSQICREDIQKVARYQNTSKITKTPTNSGSDSASISTKSPIQQSRINKVQHVSAGKLFPSSDKQPRQPSLAIKANYDHKTPSLVLPHNGSYTARSNEVVRRNKVFSEKINVAATTAHTEVQSRKPSGLRMPSPSLGFFSQPKSSASNSLSQKATQPANITGSNVSNLRKVNVVNCTYDSKLPRIPAKLLKKADNNSFNDSAEVSGSSSKCVSSSDYDNTYKTSKIAEVITENQASKRTDRDVEIQESENPCKVDESSFVQDMDFQKNDINCLMEDESFDQLKNDVNNVIVDSSEFRGSYNVYMENTNSVTEISYRVLDQDVHGTISESHSEGLAGVSKLDSMLMTHKDDLIVALDVDKWKTEKAESPNAFSGEDTHIITMIQPVRNEDNSFISPKNKREDIASDLKLCEFKISEALCSNTPPHTSAEQVNPINSGFPNVHDKYSVADVSNCSLLLEGVISEKSDGVHGLETRLNVISELNKSATITEKQHVSQDNHAFASGNFEQLQVDVMLSNTKKIISSVQDGHCYIDSQVSRDNEFAEIFHVVEKEIVRANDIETQKLQQVAETEVFSKKYYLENEKEAAEDSKIHQHHTGEPVRTTYLHSTDLDFVESLSTMEVNKSEIDSGSNSLNNRNSKVQSLDGSNCGIIKSAGENLVSMDFTDTLVESCQLPEMQTKSLVADNICKNHDSPMNDCTMVTEGDCGESRERNCLPTALIVQDQTDINHEYLLMDDCGVYIEGIDEKQCVDDKISGSFGSEALNEVDDSSLDTVFENGGLSVEATYTESNVASIAMGDQTFGTINNNEQSCSGEKMGFIDQNIRALPEIINVVDTGVGKKNSISPADTEPSITLENESIIMESQHHRDCTSYPTEDANTTISTQRPEDGGIIDNLAIKPPVNAIPFSDEWLAAMEAAGEEILTMKRGAVQNSPTNKELPEPSPWSPVKKKQNQIGPYDCTKFINAPSNSD